MHMGSVDAQILSFFGHGFHPRGKLKKNPTNPIEDRLKLRNIRDLFLTDTPVQLQLSLVAIGCWVGSIGLIVGDSSFSL